MKLNKLLCVIYKKFLNIKFFFCIFLISKIFIYIYFKNIFYKDTNLVFNNKYININYKRNIKNSEKFLFIKIIKNFSEIFIKYNIDKKDLITLLNEFPKLKNIKKNNILIIELFNNKKIKKIIWNISYNEKNIYYFTNGYFREIYVKRIGKTYLYILNLNFYKNFIFTAINNGINKNEIFNIIKIMSKHINFNNINYKDKCTILLDINNKYYNKFLEDYKPIVIKFLIKGKKYYIIRNLNGKYYNLNYINNNIIKFPINGKYKISSKFNLFRLNPFTNQVKPHRGIDIAVPIGTPVLSADNGIIKISSFNRFSGKYIIIYHGKKYFTKYMHLKKILVNEGQIIKKGDCIALSGNSGMSTGPHLHFELWIENKAIDPISIISINSDNKSYKYNIEYIKTIINII